MKAVSIDDVKKLRVPEPGSHKGQNGRLLIIGGSHLFHAASLWSLTVASRIVDLVHYSSVSENNEIVRQAKEEFRNGIVISREDIEDYIQEDDCILIGSGMMRADESKVESRKSRLRRDYGGQAKVENIAEIEKIINEGEQTEALTNYLLAKYPEKQWVIDAGALQMMDVSLIPKHAILTPHHGEFERLCRNIQFPISYIQSNEDKVKLFAKKYQCIVLLKGEKDIACTPDECRIIEGGNPGMTKGGTGDVLAGLIAALATTNDPFLSTIAGSYINKKAGDALFATVGPYFNATDLATEIPRTLKRELAL